ncbi:MAG: hypothetical protein DI563_03160 [Variovorax paradoxus]|uniref:Uncharacterized protein n=1 Tax=Variovorax paradoxus TaxID=34073 RepID=A0A2W5QMI0_VARPD|nr:MAG: hypothetical protein DI563_03160 [Variovorax paradoxus]
MPARLEVQADHATAYQWQRSTDGGATWADIAGATSASYTTPATQLADSAQQLRVQVAGTDGSVTSSVATVTVKAWVATVLATTGVTYSRPYQLALDASGTQLYVAMGNNGSVYQIDTASGSGTQVASGTVFNSPFGLALAGDGTLYVSEQNRISKVAPGATTATPWVGAYGNLFVADLENKRVRKVAADGTTSTLAGDGTQAYRDGVGTAAQLARPQGLVLSRDGSTLYDSDTDSPCLRKIDVASATVSTVLGDCAGGNAGAGVVDGTAATPARLGYAYGLATDARNNVFLTQAWDGVARVVTPAGEVSTLRDGTGTALSFNFPIGIAAAPDGTVYVGASNGNQIYRLTLAP